MSDPTVQDHRVSSPLLPATRGRTPRRCRCCRCHWSRRLWPRRSRHHETLHGPTVPGQGDQVRHPREDERAPRVRQVRVTRGPTARTPPLRGIEGGRSRPESPPVARPFRLWLRRYARSRCNRRRRSRQTPRGSPSPRGAKVIFKPIHWLRLKILVR